MISPLVWMGEVQRGGERTLSEPGSLEGWGQAKSGENARPTWTLANNNS